jgi:micrococcal nuclease
LLDEYCPDCGTHRVALFRFCLKCGLDFDELDARGDLPGGPYAVRPDRQVTSKPAASPSRSSGRLVSIATPAAVTSISPAPSRRTRRGRSVIPVGLAAVLAIAVVGALAVGAGARLPQIALEASSPEAQAAAAVTPPSPTPVPTPTPTPVFAPTGETMQGTVTSVIDGDTITASVDGTEYRIRYIGVDAPALVNLDRPIEYMGQEAADANRRLVSSANVILERDTSETDAYGQLLRNVWVDQGGTLVLVGLELVKEGFAKVDPAGPDQKYGPLLTKAEADAHRADIGMWSDPPLPLTGPTPAPAETALPRLVGVEPVTVYSSASTALRGGPGVYSWRTVRFRDPGVLVRWDLRAAATEVCQFDWRLDPSDGDRVSGSVEVKGNARATGKGTQPIEFDEALLVITTTCPAWTFSLQGARP